jgi:flagellar motor switch protein FliG
MRSNQPGYSSDQSNWERSQGADKVAALLNALQQDDPVMSEQLFESLERRNPVLAAEVERKLWRYEDLLKLPARDLQVVIRDVDRKDLILSLKTASPRLKSAIYAAVSSRAAEDIQQELSDLGPVRLSEVESAQNRITDLVQQLHRQGKVGLSRGGYID